MRSRKAQAETRHPTIAEGPPHLLHDFDHQHNNAQGLHAERIMLGSGKRIAWIRLGECPDGLPHQWVAAPGMRHSKGGCSPFLTGAAVCSCNCLEECFPEVAWLWDYAAKPDTL